MIKFYCMFHVINITIKQKQNYFVTKCYSKRTVYCITLSATLKTVVGAKINTLVAKNAFYEVENEFIV